MTDENQLDWGGMGCGVGCLEELDSNDHWRFLMDLTDMSEWRFILFTEEPSGGAGCIIGVQYSDDNMVNWKGLDNGVVGSMSTAVNDCSVIQTHSVTGWNPLNITAQADVRIRIVAEASAGLSADLAILEVQFRT